LRSRLSALADTCSGKVGTNPVEHVHIDDINELAINFIIAAQNGGPFGQLAGHLDAVKPRPTT
jgi:hypothetical protein